MGKHKHERHEGAADIAREMLLAKEPITREQVAGWAKRIADLGIYGAGQVTALRRRIDEQRVVARSYCRHIQRLHSVVDEIIGIDLNSISYLELHERVWIAQLNWKERK